MERKNVERIARVADQLCSAHAILRDEYARRALILDIAILALTLWITAMAFVDPALGLRLAPFGLGKDLWLGLLSVFAFLLAIVQIRVDWKGLADAHDRALSNFATIKQDCRGFLADDNRDVGDTPGISEKYEFVNRMSVAIPESRFTELKQRHLLKVEVSRLLDSRPGLSRHWLLVTIWWRDNFGKR